MNLIGKDAKLFRGFFKEMARLRGIPGCTYQYITEKLIESKNGNYVIIDSKLVECTPTDYPNLPHYNMTTSKSFTIHGELRAIYSEPQPIDLIFQEAPSMKTLRAIGWSSEDNSDGDKPYVIQVPFDTEKLQVGCRVLIPFSIYDNDESRKVFRITKIAVIAQFPDCYTCTIAPEFETNPIKTNPDYSKTNSNFMRNFK